MNDRIRHTLKLKAFPPFVKPSTMVAMEYFLGIAFPLFTTLAIEAPLILWMLNRYDPAFAGFVVGVNCATNLALTTLTYFVFRPGDVYDFRFLLLVEVAIFLIEAGLYALYTKKVGYSFLASFSGNLASFLVGSGIEFLVLHTSLVLRNLSLCLIVAFLLFVTEVTLYVVFHIKHAGKPSPSPR